MAKDGKLKRRLQTRTQMAREMGMTVPALKKHLVAAGVLDSSGRMPSIAAYLKDAVVWRVKADDAIERFFLLDAAVVHELSPGLSAAGDPNHVRSKHAAATLLEGAGERLMRATPAGPAADESLTPAIGWLMFESWQCIVPESASEKREFAERLGRILSDVDAEIAAGLIDGADALTAAAKDTIRSVMAWYEGRPRLSASPVQSDLAARPVPFGVLDEAERAARSARVPDGVSVALSPDELSILRGGHTLMVGAIASGPAATAIESACAQMVKSFATPENPYPACRYVRMSVDGEWLFACEGTLATNPWVFPARLGSDAVVIGPCGPDVPSDEFERMGLDIDNGLVVAEHAVVVSWRPDLSTQ